MFNFHLPSNSSLSTFISSDLAYAKNPTINWHGMLLGPTAEKPTQLYNHKTLRIKRKDCKYFLASVYEKMFKHCILWLLVYNTAQEQV